MSHYEEQIEAIWRDAKIDRNLQDTVNSGQEIQPEYYNNVNHPKHYTSNPSGVECIEIVEHMNYCLGNAIKYIWRCGYKGNTVEDLKKAIWYLNREIKRLEK